MATLTPTLTLASTDISASETLNLTLTDALTVDGPVLTKRLVVNSSEAEILTNQTVWAAADYTKSYVLLYNTSSAGSGEIITIGLASDDNTGDSNLDYADMSLSPGEWAFFPWSSLVSLVADASSGAPVLEARIYQSAS
tara:strand:- start:411 stop:827 length:417 start_codon:yes stop_codon:yes gene_type:complete